MQDGIARNGAITTVQIGSDGSFAASGEMDAPEFVSETFSVAVTCPE